MLSLHKLSLNADPTDAWKRGREGDGPKEAPTVQNQCPRLQTDTYLRRSDHDLALEAVKEAFDIAGRGVSGAFECRFLPEACAGDLIVKHGDLWVPVVVKTSTAKKPTYKSLYGYGRSSARVKDATADTLPLTSAADYAADDYEDAAYGDAGRRMMILCLALADDEERQTRQTFAESNKAYNASINTAEESRYEGPQRVRNKALTDPRNWNAVMIPGDYSLILGKRGTSISASTTSPETLFGFPFTDLITLLSVFRDLQLRLRVPPGRIIGFPFQRYAASEGVLRLEYKRMLTPELRRSVAANEALRSVVLQSAGAGGIVLNVSYKKYDGDKQYKDMPLGERMELENLKPEAERIGQETLNVAEWAKMPVPLKIVDVDRVGFEPGYSTLRLAEELPAAASAAAASSSSSPGIGVRVLSPWKVREPATAAAAAEDGSEDEGDEGVASLPSYEFSFLADNGARLYDTSDGIDYMSQVLLVKQLVQEQYKFYILVGMQSMDWWLDKKFSTYCEHPPWKATLQEVELKKPTKKAVGFRKKLPSENGLGAGYYWKKWVTGSQRKQRAKIHFLNCYRVMPTEDLPYWFLRLHAQDTKSEEAELFTDFGDLGVLEGATDILDDPEDLPAPPGARGPLPPAVDPSSV